MEFPGRAGKRDWTQAITQGPNEHGFDHFFGIPASMNYGVLTFIENTHVTEAPSLWTQKKRDPHQDTFRFLPPYAPEPSKGAIEVAPSFRDDICLRICVEKTLAYIADHAETAKTGKPFFIYLALNSPHLPHCPAPEFVGRSNVGAYGDFLLETDYRVGQVLDALDQHGLTPNTLVFQSSDNGAENGYAKRLAKYQHSSNGKLKGGKRDIYEGGHRVPFLMRWPGVIKPGLVCPDPVCQVDFLATCADLVGAKLPANAAEDSDSLLPAMRAEHSAMPSHGPIMHHSEDGHFAIREGPWKLNLFRGSGGSLKPTHSGPKDGDPPYELYDMRTDLAETTNVYAQHPDVVERLKSLATEIVRNGRSTPGAPQSNDGPQLWPELNWIPEATHMPRPKQKPNNDE
jgi:arylsulfatase A